MNRTLPYVSLVLLMIWVGLLLAAALQAFAGMQLFSEPPWLVGVALTTVGGLVYAGLRSNQNQN